MPSSPRFPFAGHFWRGLHNAGHTRSVAAVIALAALSLWLLPLTTRVPRDFLLGMFSAVALLILWWVQVDSLLQQNRPMLARLVPGHVAALRRSLVQQWLLHTGVWTALILWQLGMPWGEWLASAGWAAGIGLLLFTLVWLIRQPLLWIVFALVFFGVVFQLRRLKPGLLALRDALTQTLAEPGLTLLAVALGGLLLAMLMRLAIGAGNAGHRRRAERREHLRAMSVSMQSGCGVPVRHQQGLMGWVHRLTGLPWQWLLTRSLRPGVPAASMGRLNLLLAGPSHWARQVGVGLLIVLVVVLPLALLMAWLPPSKSGKDPMSAMRFGLCMGLFSVALNPLMQLSGALVARRREQGLLTLAPGVPQGAALRDAWSAYLVRQFFIGWGLCAAFALGLMLAFAGPGAAQFVAGFSAGCLPLLGVVWRDWGRLRGSGTVGRRNVQTTGLLVLGGGSLAGALAEYLAVAPMVSLGAGAGLVAGLALWARSQQHLRGAPFPVGRRT